MYCDAQPMLPLLVIVNLFGPFCPSDVTQAANGNPQRSTFDQNCPHRSGV
jgi:hypothetical protein